MFVILQRGLPKILKFMQYDLYEYALRLGSAYNQRGML
jgi:hypothetical protein